jgi:hypothetical protein
MDAPRGCAGAELCELPALEQTKHSFLRFMVKESLTERIPPHIYPAQADSNNIVSKRWQG